MKETMMKLKKKSLRRTVSVQTPNNSLIVYTWENGIETDEDISDEDLHQEVFDGLKADEKRLRKQDPGARMAIKSVNRQIKNAIKIEKASK